MDTLFGSAGAAAADTERMREIAREIGLDDVVKGSVSGPGANEPKILDEKAGTHTKEHGSESE
jgi:general stress protein YciG